MHDRLKVVSWPVRTQRLSIRPAEADDVEATFRYRSLDGVARWMTSADQDHDDFAERFRAPERLDRVLLVELDGMVIGDLMISIEDAWAQSEVAEQAKGVQAEIGWCLDPAYEGKGYATEAVRELLRIGFEELRLRRLFALCFADNEPSWRLMERVGMRREQHLVRESLHRSGEWLDGLGYALLAQEWRAALTPPG